MKHPAVFIALIAIASSLHGQSRPAQAEPDTLAKRPTTLGGVTVTADRDRRPSITKLTMPVSASITATKVRETVNLIDTEDAVKYLPSVFLRKRNNGDTQAVMATRSWGVSSSARSLVFADGVPLTALIGNNNTIGAPRWGLVAPEEIERIDMMYGPFSAAYAGNSMGAVMEITTRVPERREGSITQTGALQSFDLYGTSRTYGTSQTSARLSDRIGKFSFVASGNYLDSRSQPLSFVTASTFPTGTTGGFPATTKLNTPANILGASGVLHTRMVNGTFKLGYDITPTVRAAYTLGSGRTMPTRPSIRTCSAPGHRRLQDRLASPVASTHCSSGTHRRVSRSAPIVARTGTRKSSAPPIGWMSIVSGSRHRHPPQTPPLATAAASRR